ncbi:hypothetical protein RFM68_05080 [Mesorhizobium sp. MSK_1335]|uniref:Uncharacterized protein n=1 Tax=Mesorhizobium montanum TaxID=3072323 RepID=A0ABU4ZIM3_9HYPH|nr:hypothetical protein [Mesorhizobium sp. MSK_1335]MDX8523873.1 hypothetical protein [Mesorhizobium sp. MSK_1335]
MIEIDIFAERRYNDYDCSGAVALRWKGFSQAFRRFIDWYNHSFNETAQSHEYFVLRTFDNIGGVSPSPGNRHAFVVESEQSLNEFINRCVNDLNGAVGEWIKNWFTWPSALLAMDKDRQLCGAWRDMAYFCLVEKVHGHKAACAWVNGIDSTGWPEFLGAQIEYLKSQACKEMQT